jgi:hypothetical protein
MNRIIARLVLRALPAPGGIRPRLPGRFERDAGGGPIGDGASPEGWAQVAPRGPTQVERSRMDPRSAPSAPGLAARADARTPFATTDPVGEPGRPAAAFGEPGLAPLDPRRASPDPEAPAPEIGARWPMREAPLPLPPAGRHQRGPGADLEADPVSTRAFDPPLLPPWRAPEATGPTAAHIAPSGRDARAGAAPATPDIEIAIGRIEVRTPAPVRSERPVRAAPRLMSLEDYLARGRRTR